MKIIQSPIVMQEYMLNIRKEHKSIGFVPTMGFFHEGHTSLMEEARKENDIVVTSIFVNPLQFGPEEDFETYPRDEEKDIQLAKKVGVDLLFIPSVEHMYPTEMSISMHTEKRTDVLCGRSRPGHFDGVVTVLTKLFHIILPDRVYFGLKDAQQFAVVDGLITNFNFPIELIGLPTVRDENGLAKSSRNVYLSKEEYRESLALYKALNHGQQLIVHGETNPHIIIKEVKNVLHTHTSGTIDYVELLSYPALEHVHEIDEQIIIAIAVKFNRARLIDNILLDTDGKVIQSIR